MARLLLLCALFFLSAFSSEKEEYFRQHIDEAKKVVSGSCKEYLSPIRSSIEKIFKNDECEIAARVVAEDVQFRSQKTLIASIEKFLSTLPELSEYSEENKKRYAIFRKEFHTNTDNAEEQLISCMSNKDKILHDVAVCSAAAEEVLGKLKKEHSSLLEHMDEREKYKETYRRYFEDNPEKATELLEGRCKKLFDDPWYKFDALLSDKECDEALIAKSRGWGKKIRDKEYFLQNINEARALLTICDSSDQNVSRQECSNASEAVKQVEAAEKKGIQYNKYFKEHIDEAIQTAKSCPIKIDTSTQEGAKCKAAIMVTKHKKAIETLNKQKQQYKELMRVDITETKSFFKNSCSSATLNKHGEQDPKCEAANEIIIESLEAQTRDELINKLTVIKQKYADSANNISKTDKIQSEKYFLLHPREAEDIAYSCINETHQIALQCNFAISALLEKLNTQKSRAEKEKRSKVKNKEYYLRYFQKYPEEVNKTLENKCQNLFADPWYNKGNDIGNIECDVANLIRQKQEDELRAKALAKTKRSIKDKSYFMHNLKEADELSKICRGGVVQKLDECEAAIYVINEKHLDEQRMIEYTAYYDGHPLAAKFQLRWCKTAMLTFNTKCKAASNAVEKYSKIPPKQYSEELFNKYVAKLVKDLPLVKEILAGPCKERLQDPWYYLDEYIRNEKCDAALEVAGLVLEQKAKEKAKKKEEE